MDTRCKFTLSLVTTLMAGSLSAQPSVGAGHSSDKSGAEVGMGSEVLWYQNDQDQGYEFTAPSQNFESNFDAYDAQAADDFVVLEGETWIVNQVQVAGTYYNGGTGPARSENLVFYRNKHGVPGHVVANYRDVVGAPDGTSGFLITLPSPLTLPPGKYWLSVQVNMHFNIGGEWAWQTRATRRLKKAVWRNPGGGFASPCRDYADLRYCSNQKETGPDLMFTLFGERQLH
jgi:hypothetical protein